MKTLIRIKRRADEEPVENILVKPKRARFCEIGSAVARAPDVQPTVLERVATVESKEEELELNVFKKEKVYKKGWELREQYKKPHKLEGFKASARREAKERESYKRHMVHASHRGNLDDTELGKEGGAESKEDEDKELHAEGNKKDAQKSEGDDKADDSPSVSPPHEIKYLDVEFIQKMDDVITCNGEPMQSEKYVYDIYYSPDNVNWTEYACDIQKYMYDSTDETLDFDDEDDENAEDNWRNDYPDEEDDDDSSFDGRLVSKHRTMEQQIWSHEAIFGLLQKVREKEVLWNIKHSQYHKKTLKRSLFDQICKELKEEYPDMGLLTTDVVVAKFAYLLGHFQKQLRKIQTTPSGSGAKATPKWEYFQACSFLQPLYNNSKSEPSFQLTPNSTQMVVYEGSLDDLLEMDEPASSPSPALSASSYTIPSPSTTPTPPHNWTPKVNKKRKAQDSAQLMQQKIMESLDCVKDAWRAHAHQSLPFRFDAATEAVMSFMNTIPNSHQHLKDEFTEKVYFLVAEIMKKYNNKKNLNQ